MANLTAEISVCDSVLHIPGEVDIAHSRCQGVTASLGADFTVYPFSSPNLVCFPDRVALIVFAACPFDSRFVSRFLNVLVDNVLRFSAAPRSISRWSATLPFILDFPRHLFRGHIPGLSELQFISKSLCRIGFAWQLLIEFLEPLHYRLAFFVVLLDKRHFVQCLTKIPSFLHKSFKLRRRFRRIELLVQPTEFFNDLVILTICGFSLARR